MWASKGEWRGKGQPGGWDGAGTDSREEGALCPDPGRGRRDGEM